MHACAEAHACVRDRVYTSVWDSEGKVQHNQWRGRKLLAGGRGWQHRGRAQPWSTRHLGRDEGGHQSPQSPSRGCPPSLLMVSGMLWTVWSLTHELVSICSSTDVREKLLKPGRVDDSRHRFLALSGHPGTDARPNTEPPAHNGEGARQAGCSAPREGTGK